MISKPRPPVAIEGPIHWEPAHSFLKLVVGVTLSVGSVYLLGLMLLVPEQKVRLGVVSLLLVIAGVDWQLLRRGRVEAAVWTMAIGTWLYTTASSFFVGGVEGTSIIIYPIIIVLLGWLVGIGAAIGAAVLTTAATLAMVLADAAGLLPTPWATPPTVRWVIQFGVFALTAAIIGSVVRSYRQRLEEVEVLTADLRRAQDVARIGSWTYDLTADVMKLSDEARRIFGVPSGFPGTREGYLARVHPDDRSSLSQAWTLALAGRQALDHEHRILVDGEVRWVRQTAEFERLPGDVPMRSVGTVQDITGRKRIEEALALSRIGVERASEALLWIAPDGRVLDVNAAACEALGYTREELVRRSMADVDVGFTPERWAAHTARLAAEGSETLEARYRTREGREFPVEILASQVRIGNDVRECAFVRDISERKAREAEVLEARSQLEATLAAIPDLLFEADLEGRYLLCHAPAAELLAAPPDHLLGRTVSDVMPPDSAAVCLAALREAHETGRSHGRQYELPLAAGTRWFELSVARKATGPGEPPRFIVVSRDVTVRKQAEDGLRAGEEQLRCILGSTADGILAVDREGRVMRTNERFAELWRIPPGLVESGDDGALLAHVLDQLTDPGGFLAKVRSLYGSDARETDTISFKDGRLFERFTAPLVLNGAPAGRVWSFRDVTERTRAQRRLAMALDLTRLVFWELDLATGRIEYDMSRLEEPGIEEHRTLQTLHDWTARVHPDDRARFERCVARALAPGGPPFDCEYRLTNPSGPGPWLHTRARVVQHDAHGRPALAVGSSVDITERRRFEEARLRSQKLEALGTLAGGIAHDFNNILSAIRGNADFLVDHLGPDHGASASLAEIRRATTRASDLVRRIRVFGQTGEARHEPVDLAGVVHEVLQLLRSTLPAGITLGTAFAAEAPLALADAGQVHEVIVNLSTNAAYAIGSRPGSITYGLEPVTVDEALAPSIPGLVPGRYVRITVSDTGCGMDAAMLERIFDAFYTTRPAGEGTGLGLSVVHGIMKSHGGAVAAESRPGEGSSFALYFRAAPADRAGDRPAPALAPGLARRVLFVDDEEAIVSIATRMLSRRGHEVDGYTDPVAALAALDARPDAYDVVVTDLAMPRMSGLDVARHVRASRPGVFVILTSGWLRPGEEHDATAAGVSRIVLKPIDMRELGDAIAALPS